MGYIEELRAIVGTRPLILVGAVVLILDATDRLLLQRRSATLWGLPGGLMEPGESVEDTARREVAEEIGCTVGELKLFELFSGPEFYIKLPNGDEFYSVTAAYSACEVQGELVIDGEETLEARYFGVDELPEHVAIRHRLIIDRFFAQRGISKSAD